MFYPNFIFKTAFSNNYPLYTALLSGSRWIGNPVNHLSTTVRSHRAAWVRIFSTIPDSANPTSRGRLRIRW